MYGALVRIAVRLAWVVIPSAIAAAIAYFFGSNQSARRQQEYRQVVNSVLEVLKQKAEMLSKRNRELEQQLQQRQTDIELQRQKESLEAELVATRQELEEFKTEAENWRSTETTDAPRGMIALVSKSSILKSADYNAENALQVLKERKRNLRAEIETYHVDEGRQ